MWSVYDVFLLKATTRLGTLLDFKRVDELAGLHRANRKQYKQKIII